MTHRELSRRIFIIALPASLQFIVSYVQVSTDMAFIGHYNTAGLSAIQNVQIVGVSVILPLAYLAMFHFRLGFAGLLWVIFFDEFRRSAANLLRLRFLYSRERRRFA